MGPGEALPTTVAVDMVRRSVVGAVVGTPAMKTATDVLHGWLSIYGLGGGF